MNQLLIAACSTEINKAKAKLVLVPAGEFEAVDGRPHDVAAWSLNAANGQALATKLNSIKKDMMIDYEHASLSPPAHGAPASGWIKAGSFEFVDDVGLVTNSWSFTAKATAHIADQEYRYLSPVIQYDKDGQVNGLINVALTNTPALDVLPEVKLAAASRLGFSPNKPQTENQKESIVDDILIDALGLQTDATVDDAIAAISKLKTAALNQQKPNEPDPAKYVPKSMYDAAQQTIAELSQSVDAQATSVLIQAALNDGRLVGKDATDYARRFVQQYGLAAFEAEMARRPKVAALKQRQTDTIDLNAANAQQPHDDISASIAAQLGMEA